MSHTIIRPVSAAVLLLAFGATTAALAADVVAELPPASVSTPSALPRIIRTDSGLPISAEAVESALASSSLAVTLQLGETFSAYGIEADATGPSRIFASASSELLTVAVVDGRIRVAALGELLPGEAAVLVIATGEVRRASIDAARLEASLPTTVRADLGPALQQVANSQAKRRWWGYYTPLGLNAQAPVPPDLEALRRQYLLDPAAVHLRRDADGHIGRQRELAAGRFVTALCAHDISTVAGLLDPSPFVQSGSGWTATRTGYAQRLIRSSLATDLATAVVTPVAEVPGSFVVSTANNSWTLTTAERDNMTFVTGITARQPLATDNQTPVATLQGDAQ